MESLTTFPGTDTAGRMGRPPLNVKETKVRLSADQKSRIEAIAGAKRMAVWIRAAVDTELERQEAEVRNARSDDPD